MRKKKDKFIVAGIMTVLALSLAASFYWSVNPLGENSHKIVLPKNQDSLNGEELSQSENNFTSAFNPSKAVITNENVISVIKTLSRPQTYSYEVVSTYYYGEKSGSIKSLFYSSGDYSKTELLNDNGMTRTHIITGKQNSFIWQAGQANYTVLPKGEVTSDDTQFIPTYEDVLKIDEQNIRNAAFVTKNGQGCIYIEYFDDLTQYIEKYWISAENGLLLYAQILDESGAVIYDMQVSNLVLSVNEEVFRLAGNRLVQDVENEMLSE